MSALLQLEEVSSGYGQFLAVRGLSIEVHPGEIVAMLGRNGAGKSTTLLTISGFVGLKSGSILFEGQPLPDRPDRVARLGVGHVVEERALFPSLTVADNLIVAGCRNKSDFAAIYEVFPELEVLQKRRVGLCSGGEQQMLAIARALAQHPKLLLVDEMSLGLAPLVAERLVAVLRTLASERGLGVLLVEQHVSMALRAADRGYLVQKGTLVASGTAAELTAEGERLEAAYLASAN